MANPVPNRGGDSRRKVYKRDLVASRESNNVLGPFWRVSHIDDTNLGDSNIYAGYTKKEALQLHKEHLEKGGN